MVFYCIYVVKVLTWEISPFSLLLPPAQPYLPLLVIELWLAMALNVCLSLSSFLTLVLTLVLHFCPCLCCLDFNFVSDLLLGLTQLLMPEACIYNTHCHEALGRMIEFSMAVNSCPTIDTCHSVHHQVEMHVGFLYFMVQSWIEKYHSKFCIF